MDGGGNNISLTEARMLQKIRHKNIVRYHDGFKVEGKMYLVMEYCDKGDLNQFLKRTGGKGGVMEMPTWRMWKFLV